MLLNYFVMIFIINLFIRMYRKYLPINIVLWISYNKIGFPPLPRFRASILNLKLEWFSLYFYAVLDVNEWKTEIIHLYCSFYTKLFSTLVSQRPPHKNGQAAYFYPKSCLGMIPKYCTTNSDPPPHLSNTFDV